MKKEWFEGKIIGIICSRLKRQLIAERYCKGGKNQMVEKSIFSGESKNIEYKVMLPDKSEKYMKTIIAFANTQGVKLIVGVDDETHQIVGVENEILFEKSHTAFLVL